MALFRRREPLHERLAREGGLYQGAAPPHDTRPRWGEAGIHGLHRPRAWDAVLTAEAPAFEPEELQFVVLPDGTVLVEEDVPDETLEPLAAALGTALEPPYRGEAVRRGSRWAVAGRTIRVAELPPDVMGEALELTVHEGRRELRVDGEIAFGSIPALEWLAGRHESFVVRAERLDGALWEIEAAAL
ncbi:MAG: hypothetical protein ABR521_01830 [Gaiellaceae bacterium]